MTTMTTTTTIPALRRLLGERGFALALTLARGSEEPLQKTIEASAVVHLRKGATKAATVRAFRAVVEISRAARAARASRNTRRVFARSAPAAEQWLRTCKPYKPAWLRGSLAERLAELRASREESRLGLVATAAAGLLGATRTPSVSVHRLTPGAPLAEVRGSAWSEQGERYSSRCTWRKTEAHASLTIPHDYEATVIETGLGPVVHGLLTLAALPVESERPGEQVYRAIWLRKGQGFSLIREDGYIIRRAGELAHGPSISACRATLTRRLNLVAQPERDEALRLKLSGPLSGLNGCSQVLVHLRHSKAAGNCGPGTLAFRDRHFPGRESATVAELLSAAEQAGPDIRQRVIAACVIACRRIAATA